MLTPPFSIDEDVVVEFYYKRPSTTGALKVYTTSDKGYTEYELLSEDLDAKSSWTKKQFTLSASVYENRPNIRIAFHSTTRYDYDDYDYHDLDNVKVYSHYSTTYDTIPNAAGVDIRYELFHDNLSGQQRICVAPVEGGYPDTITIPTAVVIESDSCPVNGILRDAFKGNTNITRVRIEGLSSKFEIADSAFYGCTSLDSLVLPTEGLEHLYVGAYAFKGCTALSPIDITAATLSGEPGAFYGCDLNLDSCQFFSVNNKYDYKVLAYANVVKVNEERTDLDVSSSKYSKNVLYYNDRYYERIVHMPIYYTDSIEIDTIYSEEEPGKVYYTDPTEFRMSGYYGTYGGSYAFAGTKLTEISIWSDYDIYDHDFEGCDSLTKFDISSTNPPRLSSPNVFDGSAYYDICHEDGVMYWPPTKAYYAEEVSGLNTVHIREGVTEIGDTVFKNFWANSSTPNKSIVLPSTLKKIRYGAFEGMKNVRKIELPKSLTGIGDRAFANCSYLQEINLGDCQSLTGIGKAVFMNSGLQRVVIPDGVSSIGYCAFKGCSSMDTLTIPESVEQIELQAFRNSGVTTLFWNARNAKYYSDNDDESEKINYQPFYDGRLRNVVIGDSVRSLCEGFLRYNQYVSRLDIPETVETIHLYAFENAVIDTISLNSNFDLGNTWSYSYSKFPFASEKQSPFNRIGVKNIIVGNNITALSDNMFADIPTLVGVTLSAGVKTVGNSAFEGCTSLTNISLPDKLSTIGHAAFSGCEAIEKIVLPDSITMLSNSLFADCTSLSDITLSGRTEQIGDSTFYGCMYLDTITLPHTLKSIGSYAFYDCLFMNYISFPQALQSIGEYAFAETGLISVTIPQRFTYISEGMFENCRGLHYINVAGGMKSELKRIESNAFAGCDEIRHLLVPYGVESIDYGAFAGCNKLRILSLPHTLKNIHDHAFYGCDSLKYVKAFPIVPPTIEMTDDPFDEDFLASNPVDLFVPLRGLAAYKKFNYWPNFHIIGIDLSEEDEYKPGGVENIPADPDDPTTPEDPTDPDDPGINTSTDAIGAGAEYVIDNGTILFFEESEVAVYTTTGVCVYSGTTHEVQLPQQGIYIVVTPQSTTKVAY